MNIFSGKLQFFPPVCGKLFLKEYSRTISNSEIFQDPVAYIIEVNLLSILIMIEVIFHIFKEFQ